MPHRRSFGASLRRVGVCLSAILLGGALAAQAHAGEHRFQALLDTDNNASTGCSVSTSRGPATGIEEAWTTVVTTTASTVIVTRIERQTCVGGALGAPAVFSTAGWSAGTGNGSSGTAAIETFIPRSVLPTQGTLRMLVASLNATGGQDATTSFAVTIAAAPPPPPRGRTAEPIPLSPWLVPALAAVVFAAVVWLRRRYPGQGALMLCIALVAASGLVWAATVTLDGNVGDWKGIAPDATNAKGSAPVDANIVAVFHQLDATNLYLRIDADVVPDAPANQMPSVSAGADQTITLPAGATLAGSASDDGLPNPPGALTVAWSTLSGPGTVGFGNASAAATTATFSQSGVYVLRLTANDGTLASFDDVQITVNGAGDAAPVTHADAIDTSPGFAVQLNVLANDTDADGDPLSVIANGQGAHGSVTCGADGSCTYTPQALFSGQDTFTYTASDGKGGQTLGTVTVNVSSADATVSAPPIVGAFATTLGRSSRFLYTGANPLQTGVPPGTIDDRRVAVLRGKVTTRDGAELAGATIAILDHPDFGQTLTRSNGRFDLAVNGGGLLTIKYSAAGFLPLQKQVRVPWQDYVIVPAVSLVPLDAQVTAITANAPTAQLHRASTIFDGDGSRRATVLVLAGTTATMTFPNGTAQPLTTMHVRATEYTVGPNGPAAMPAGLPALSGYTYCVELSVDEAIAAGAIGVVFSQPVITYVENFLKFPVGVNVPVGIYDRVRGAWVPSANGRVIKILGVTGGLADVDTDGDGAADDGLAMTTAERQQLAALYAPGQSVWRVAVAHFSPEDSNWRNTIPEDAVAPSENGAGPDPNDPLQDPRCSSGSIVECENQVLGESVRIVGTPFMLNYRSDRVPGLLATRNIRLSGPSVPASLASIGLHMAVAGRSFDQTFPAAANQQTTFTWDRQDAYGRQVLGGQTLSVTIDYNYPTTYTDPGPQPTAFNSVGGVSLGTTPSRQELNVSQSFTTMIGEGLTDARVIGLGGWTLSGHQMYDSNARVVHLGSGSRVRAGSIARTLGVTHVTGHSILFDVEVGPDGAQYVALPHGDLVVRIGLDGAQTVVAGNGTEGFSGDGGPATQAELGDPTGIAFGPDGSMYIAEESNFRVRKVARDGTISTIAGTGAAGFSGDGGPATLAELQFAERIAVGPDSSIYLLDGQRVRRITTDGIINTVAGNGAIGGGGDNGPATAASINASSISAAPDGGFYIADFGNHRVRRVTPDGIIKTVADYTSSVGRPVSVRPTPDGSLLISIEFGSARTPQVDLLKPDGSVVTIAGGGPSDIQSGIPATQANLVAIRASALSPDGSIYVVRGDNGDELLRISPALPGFEDTETFIATADGSALYVFDSDGKQLRTVNALTGAVLVEYGYDGAGRLTQITEKTGGTDNVTTIDHDASGNPAKITSPFGQVTTLGVDANGFLNKVTNPAGETVQMAYDAGGLMSSYSDARGKTSTFAFDDTGHLLSDADPVGGSQSLARVTAGNQFTVTRTTKLGRVTTYATQNLAGSRQIRTMTEPDGTQSQTDETIDAATMHASSADGSTSDTLHGPDPRFGMQAPLPSSVTITLPDGLKFTGSVKRDVALGNGGPLSLASLTDTVTIDGRETTSAYTAATRTTVSTSPAGRELSLTTDALGRPIASQFSGLQPTTFGYDARGRVTGVVWGSGATARTLALTYDASGFPQSITDPVGRTAHFVRDPAGRITSKTLAGGQVVAFQYDAAGNMTGLTPPGRPAYTFTYSDRNELIGVTAPPEPGTGATTFSFDSDKQLTAVNFADNRAINLGYDAFGRLVTRSFTANGTTTGTDTLAYDNAGRMASITAASGAKTTYGYNGPFATSESWTGPVAGSVSRAYDSAFRLSSLTVNGGAPIAFAYDNDSLVIGAGDLALTRDAQHGMPVATTLGNVTTTIVYNGFGELDAYQAKASSVALFGDVFQLDALGRVTQKTEAVGGVTDTYTYAYDAGGQLTTVVRNGTTVESYGYDANGNRTSATVGGASIAATYDSQDRIAQYGTTVYDYDAVGNLASETTGAQVAQYQYDRLGNLTGATLPDGTAIAYVVDGRSRRIGKKVNGVLVQGLLYGDGLRPVAELDGNGALVSVFVYAGGNAPSYLVKGGVNFRLVTDQLGSVRLVVNAATGAIVQRLDYDSFGDVTLDTNPGFQPFGFAGGLYDRDTGLVRFGARDYEARTGRWTAKDPAGFLGNDTNLYRYARNDPVNLVDSTGMGTVTDALVGVAAGLVDLLNHGFMPSPPPPPPVILPDGRQLKVPSGNFVTELADLINTLSDETVVDTDSLAYTAGGICAGLVTTGAAGAGGKSLIAAEELAALRAANAERLAAATSRQIDFAALKNAQDLEDIAKAGAKAAERAIQQAKDALGNMQSTGWQTGGGGPIGGIGGGGGH